MVVVEGATLATLVAEPSPCSSLVFFLISSGSASSAGHCSRSQPMHCRSSSASPGDLHISGRGRSDRCHRRWLRYGRFRTHHRAVRFLNGPFSCCPPCHRAAIGASCGTRRLRCNIRPCSCWGPLGLVAGSVRRFRRHHRRVHRLGARVYPD